MGSSRAQLRKQGPAVIAPVASTTVIPVSAEPIDSDFVPHAPLAAVASTAEEASAAVTEAPLSRRARRIATGSLPVVEEPDIAPVGADEAVLPAAALPTERDAVDAPAPVREPVLTTTDSFELIEPEVVVLEQVDDEPVSEPVVAAVAEEPQAAASDQDAFEAAARLFSFTGELPTQQPADVVEDAAAESHEATTRVRAPRAAKASRSTARVSRGTAFRRVATMSFSVGVMGVVGLLTVGMTTPAEAVAAMGSDATTSVTSPLDGITTEIAESEIQAYVAPATVEEAALNREGSFDTVTRAELASESGIANFSDLFTNDPNAAIQWPFAVGVPMSYGFGMRSGRMHEGIDFTPGAGSPVQAIADGVVRVATESGGAYGVHVIIDHEIDGVLVSSHYGHMEYGSLQVSVGEHVTVGTVIGRTGNTGRSFGAHTHFEILMNGTTPIDPLPWLREHAGG